MSQLVFRSAETEGGGGERGGRGMARRRERGWAASARAACGREGMRACTQRRVHGAHVGRACRAFCWAPGGDPGGIRSWFPCKIASSAFSNFVRFLCNDHTFVAPMWCDTFEVKTTSTSRCATSVFSFFFSAGSKIHLSTSSRARDARHSASRSFERSRLALGRGEALVKRSQKLKLPRRPHPNPPPLLPRRAPPHVTQPTRTHRVAHASTSVCASRPAPSPEPPGALPRATRFSAAHPP